ncbi:multidrug MFS transporter [Lactiplantibacillus brownii]
MKLNETRMVKGDFSNQDVAKHYEFMKRLCDLTLSVIGIIVLMPLLGLIALAIKVEAPRGRIFYSQIRLGKQQVPFRMFKFRSMVSDADAQLEKLHAKNEVTGAMFKMKEDPRITRVGKFLRRYSLDELPQLLNVILGSMSLVGPRPPLPRETQKYTTDQLRRLTVKPGCTGLWQATSRNQVGFEEMVLLDLQYIQRRSLSLDSWILLRTLLVFIRPTGI